MVYDAHFNTRQTPVDQPIPGRTMVRNNDGGGFAFRINDRQRLERFVVLGAEGGTYYVGERELTVANAEAAVRLFAQEATGLAAIGLVLEVSTAGRAHKNDPALFALAIATASPITSVRQRAWQVLPLVARTGMHLLTFVRYREAVGGWGPLARRGIAAWYLQKSPEAVAFQALKYQQRDDWSQRDVLRLAHVRDTTGTETGAAMNAVLRAIAQPVEATHELRAGGPKGAVRQVREEPGVERLVADGKLPAVYIGVLAARRATKAADVADAIRSYGLHREMIPTQWQSDPVVLAALFEKQPMTAMIRNLGNLSKAGVLGPMSDVAREVCSRLRDEAALAKARIHPVSVLLALRTYASGKGRRGKGEWIVVPQVVQALEDALALSFKYAPKTGQRFLLGVDVSASMQREVGDTGISSREMAALVALAIAKQESEYFILGFCHRMVDLKITAADTFASATEKAYRAEFGSTKIDKPMTYALENKIPVDVFAVFTDNEVNRGIHPAQALKQYREKTGLPAKMAVCAFDATDISVADPNDVGMLDICGLDSSVPGVLADFAR